LIYFWPEIEYFERRGEGGRVKKRERGRERGIERERGYDRMGKTMVLIMAFGQC
jgi:hypothetical protein